MPEIGVALARKGQGAGAFGQRSLPYMNQDNFTMFVIKFRGVSSAIMNLEKPDNATGNQYAEFRRGIRQTCAREYRFGGGAAKTKGRGTPEMRGGD